MKIFMVHEDPWHAGNPYIFTLIEELKRQHPQDIVSWGRELFWSEEIFSYDIVHFHWPQAFMAGDTHTENDLLKHIREFKRRKVKVVSTCHDLQPHYNQCSDHSEAMKIVYNCSDMILHLGSFSMTLFEKEYPKSTHVLLPHHLYNTLYKKFPSKKESAKYLNFAENKKYIICFGIFRSNEERNLIINLSKTLDTRIWKIIAPGFMNIYSQMKSLKRIKQRLRKLYYKLRYGIYCTGKSFAPVPDEDVPYYYGLADIALIHRVKVLNSGNAYMPMLFSKVVVGPDVGNVGPLLKKWGYPVFDVCNLSTLNKSIEEGLALVKRNIPQLLRKQQLEEYSTEKVTECLYKYYSSVI